MSWKIESRFIGWDIFSKNLKRIAIGAEKDQWLNEGQRKSLLSIAKNLPHNGMVIADEVGMGKTRIAVAVAKSVTEAGGRVAVLIPPGLGYQWQEEFRLAKIQDVQNPIRSLHNYVNLWPEGGWFASPIQLISHLFSNWPHRASTHSWRVSLLPELYAMLRKQETTRLPKYYLDWKEINTNDKIVEIAESIVSSTPLSKSNPARRELSVLSSIKWSEDLYDGSSYTKENGSELQELLKKCIGIGLGVFDLIIIDEAHKNRGDQSGLSKLLNEIICRSSNHRVLGLTATPVELELDDWKKTLARIGIRGEKEEEIKQTIEVYSREVKKVRESWKINEEDRKKFISASNKFERALKKILLRRDKSMDNDVIGFQNKTDLPYHKYRAEKEISIDPIDSEFPENWKRAIIATEALSFASTKNDSSRLKRLRLTVASGHGIGTWLDSQSVDVEKDREGLKESEDLTNHQDKASTSDPVNDKKQERIQYWKNIIHKSFPKREGGLFEHPLILSAVNSIESEYTKFHHKVLVFGKFTRPMRALTILLNAREMLRRIDGGKFWPQYKLSSEEGKAVQFALSQIKSELKNDWDIEKVKLVLKKNENKAESSRKKFRRQFFKLLEEGFTKSEIKNNHVARQIINHMEARVKAGRKSEVFNHLTIACYESLYGVELIENVTIDPVELCNKYLELFYAITDLDKETEEDSAELDESKIENILELLNESLKIEYGTQLARFARFMFGETQQHTRRLIQLSFNRSNSFPYVLVAQSKVGREGLNLHKACKTVMMLHPEWNPAVAEQQIGRVDRLGSLWAQQIQSYEMGNGEIPRIEIRPMVFKNTYDDQNWRVLRERWDDLRAQLHGIIIPDRIYEICDEEDRKIIEELNDAAPSFMPE